MSDEKRFVEEVPELVMMFLTNVPVSSTVDGEAARQAHEKVLAIEKKINEAELELIDAKQELTDAIFDAYDSNNIDEAENLLGVANGRADLCYADND